MKIRTLSDLHLEFEDWIPPKTDADVVVLAGDIHVGVRAIEWARRSFPSHPVVYVPGNHEFYGGCLREITDDLHECGRRSGVVVLDGQSTSIGGVRFLGATLWTDFALHGSDTKSVERAMAVAQSGMYDFQSIRFGSRYFSPLDARAIHLQRVEWLRTELAREYEGQTVVVTHHLPLRQSIHPKYSGSQLNPSFATDLSSLMGPVVSVWIHGHTHESFDYVVNGTRIVCNPRGYSPMEINPAFNPMLTIDVPATADGDSIDSEAVAAYNDYVEEHGLFSDRVRSFQSAVLTLEKNPAAVSARAPRKAGAILHPRGGKSVFIAKWHL